MKHFTFYVLLLLLFFILPFSNCHAITLSNKTEISLLTCGPGEELYSIFGHSAIRVCDSVNNIDRVYNYGTFDFETEHFYLKFAGGRLFYYLNTEEFWGFIKTYTRENITVYEQILNLDSIKKQTLYNLLEKNNLPANKFYRYDFFYDNCTTRIRDILIKALDNKIDFTAYVPPPIATYRKMISHYIEHLKWTDLGIDLIFGLPADHKMKQSEYMFLPIELMHALDSAHNSVDNAKLVKETKTLYLASNTKEEAPSPFSPILFFWLLFALFVLITLFEIWKNINLWILDFLLFFITGLLGLLVITLSVGSTYIALHNNLVVLWAIPLHVIMALFVARKNSKVIKYYFLFTTLWNIILLICWYFIPQELNMATFPFVLLLTIRAFKIYYFKSIEKTRKINTYY